MLSVNTLLNPFRVPSGWCPARPTPNRCTTCGEEKPCSEMQMRRGLPHRHSPGVCKTCRARKWRPAYTYNECDCGGPKRTHTTRCIQCYQGRGPTGESRRPPGKTYKTSDGYVLVHAPDHPSAMHDGNVFEHRVAMELVIGRMLERHETVHHLNGDRTDNRPENLELWTKPQPTGIRASDALAVAINTVRLLAPHLLAEEPRHGMERQHEAQHPPTVLAAYSQPRVEAGRPAVSDPGPQVHRNGDGGRPRRRRSAGPTRPQAGGPPLSLLPVPPGPQ